jgi:hypothetical protein
MIEELTGYPIDSGCQNHDQHSSAQWPDAERAAGAKALNFKRFLYHHQRSQYPMGAGSISASHPFPPPTAIAEVSDVVNKMNDL